MYAAKTIRADAPAGDELVAQLDAAMVGAVDGNWAETTLAALPVAIYTTDAIGRITFYNEAAVELWGRRPTLEAESWCGSWKIYTTAGAYLPLDECPMAVTIKTGVAVRGVEAVAERPDGTRVPFAPFPTPLRDASGQMVGAINMLVDLTARKTAEEALRKSEEDHRRTAELDAQMHWTADPRGRILHFNDRWRRLVGDAGVARADRGWRGMVNPADVPAALRAVARSVASGVPLDVRVRLRTADGSERWVRSRGEARRNDAGEILEWRGSITDIHDAVLAEAGMQAAEDRYRLASEASHDVVWDHDLVADVVSWTDSIVRRFGLIAPDGRTSGAWWLSHIHPDDVARVADSYVAVRDSAENGWTCEYRFRRADGRYASVLDRGTMIRDARGVAIRAIGAIIDLSDSKRAEEAMRLSEERFRIAATAAGLGVCDQDMINGRTHWSAELREILGVDPALPVSPEFYFSLIHHEDRAGAIENHRRALAGDFSHGYRGLRRIFRHKDGALRWIITQGCAMHDDEGHLARIIITARDITEEKAAQDRINWAANHDGLTGLPNRMAFEVALERAMIEAKCAGSPVSVLLMDMDNFKRINDMWGHQAGDSVLITFARRISAAMPAGAVVARFGGDEFAAILPGADAAAARAAAEGLLGMLRPAFDVGGRLMEIRASIGVGVFPDHARDAAEIVQNADIALYASKAAGRATVSSFQPSLRADLQRQMSALQIARTALDEQWIRPFYQPKIALDGGHMVGLEALLRWDHPRHGLQLPCTIAHAFNDLELSARIGERMAELVLADMRGWLDRGLQVGKVALNAAPAEFHRIGFADRLLGRMAAHGVPAHLLELEITETAFLGASAAAVVAELDTLRAAGVTIALDDFGTGCSSLSHLRQFPVDVIKIDQSFVSGISGSTEDRAIVQAVLHLGKALGMVTVAEGVETADQAAWLREEGCALAQGHLYAHAVTAEEAVRLLS